MSGSATIAQSLNGNSYGENGDQQTIPELTHGAYPDGAHDAPKGTPELPNLFAGYPVRPPWEVAGVDYHVGLPAGTPLKDPRIAANLPAGVELNTASHTLIVTADNVTLKGLNFSFDGGYGIYIAHGVSGTKIVDNLFVDSDPKAPIPVNIAVGASNTYIADNTIDAGGAHGNAVFGETILNLGTGLTVEYNFIKNAPQHFVSTNGGALTDEFNLMENGGWLPGAHLNFLQFAGGHYEHPRVAFNTLVQARTVASGEGVQMYTNLPGSISDGYIGNNTMISVPTDMVGHAANPAISYWVHAGDRPTTTATGSVQDNYIDTRSAYGAFYPGLKGFSYSDNINLLTGRPF